MKIGIVGWGVEGQSAYHYFGSEHEYLIVNESAQDNFPPESDKIKVRFLANTAPVGIAGQVTDLSYLKGVESCDRIVYQPTSYFNLRKAFGDNPDFWAKATTVYDIFFEQCPTKNIIGVTGSKGKGTTSTLIARMLQAQGQTAQLGGNIGTPILDLLSNIKSDDWVVWELANFQLKAASYSPHIAVCLMITEEHQDWHPDMQDYLEAKANIFRHQKAEDIAIYFAKNDYSKRVAQYSAGKKVPYYEPPGVYVRDDGMIVLGRGEIEIIHKSEVKLLGEHNLQNVCAAATAVFDATGSLDKAEAVLSSFSGLEHRLELVREFGGVKYYDDSFATTPDSAIVAIRTFRQPKVLILGGHDKGLNFEPLVEEIVRSNVRQVIAIGKTADRVAASLKNKGFAAITLGLEKMPNIIAEAQRNARNGDVVLLSTGFPSFGLFKDYKDRGNQFKKAVRALD